MRNPKQIFVQLLLLPLLLAACATGQSIVPAATATSTTMPTFTPAPTPTPAFLCLGHWDPARRVWKALVDLYDSTNGENWNTNFDEWLGRDLWLTSSTPCNWGVHHLCGWSRH
jgi:hypothetical protein